MDETKLTAHLPGLDIQITKRVGPGNSSEGLSIELIATPSFAAVGQRLAGAGPFALLTPPGGMAVSDPWTAWNQFWQLWWQPWLSWLPTDWSRTRD